MICLTIMLYRKNRFDSVFSFLEAGSSGVRADKTGNGLVKVWKLQLQQLHNLGPDVATAIVTSFPSPLALKQVNHFFYWMIIQMDIGFTYVFQSLQWDASQKKHVILIYHILFVYEGVLFCMFDYIARQTCMEWLLLTV